MSDQVFVTGLVIHAYHGALEHEGRVGQPFVLDLVLDLDVGAAARSDKLADTVDYDAVVQAASRAFAAHRFRLLEAAASEVVAALFAAFPRVTRIRASVKKPHAPIAAVFENVGVAIERTRDG